jgi:pimeloyl-ACP methyl ester carboxylesterase
MNWREFSLLNTTTNEVRATLTVKSPDAAERIATLEFRIRGVPVILIHGIADTGSTWGDAFLGGLRRTLPENFIRRFSYGEGQGWDQRWPCTKSRLQDLAVEVDEDIQAIELDLKSNWAFTRIDLVGHSQGGVIARMLCQTDPAGNGVFTKGSTPVVSASNFFRGRFRRVITIGSPHNGSLLLFYIDEMRASVSPIDAAICNAAYFAAPAIAKFDPNKVQIRTINDPNLPVHPRIKFHCIQTTINGGEPPSADFHQNPAIYNLLGLDFTLKTGEFANWSRGEVLLLQGSDGVVDFVSQGGGSGTPASHEFGNVAHAKVDGWFGVPRQEDPPADTKYSEMGRVVGDLLTGPDSRFGAFRLPALMSKDQKRMYDNVVPGNFIVRNLLKFIPTPKDLSTNITCVIAIPEDLARASAVTWEAVVYGPKGITTEGITVLVETNDPTRMTLGVDSTVLGDVIATAFYTMTNGSMVLAEPLLVGSYRHGVITNISIESAPIILGLGETVPINILGGFSDGTESYIYTPLGSVNFLSSNPAIASVSSNGVITLNSFGSAKVRAKYGEFQVETTVSTATPLSPRILSGVDLGKGFQLTFLASPGYPHLVQASTELIDPEGWVLIGTLVPTNSISTFVDATFDKWSHRFYRIIAPSALGDLSSLGAIGDRSPAAQR